LCTVCEFVSDWHGHVSGWEGSIRTTATTPSAEHHMQQYKPELLKMDL